MCRSYKPLLLQLSFFSKIFPRRYRLCELQYLRLLGSVTRWMGQVGMFSGQSILNSLFILERWKVISGNSC